MKTCDSFNFFISLDLFHYRRYDKSHLKKFDYGSWSMKFDKNKEIMKNNWTLRFC